MPSLPERLAVHAWPYQVDRVLADLRSGQACTVISVPTPHTTDRVRARALIRTALRQTLADFLAQPVASIRLVSRPGQGIRVESTHVSHLSHASEGFLSVSVSHAPGLSVAALGRGVAVGVDVMPLDPGATEMPDWERVAQDYLGPVVTKSLWQTPAAQRPAAFTQAWTHVEACLKCLNLPLTEWTPALAQQLASCRIVALALPDKACGSIAIHQDDGA